MCHLSMKLSDKFDPNQMYTSDKIVVKHIVTGQCLCNVLCITLVPYFSIASYYLMLSNMVLHYWNILLRF